MKAVRIIVPEVHDGLGGVHKAGDIAVLPAEIAQIFIDKNCGVEASEAEHAAAIAKAEAALDDRRMAENKAAAVQRMRVHDAMPSDVREAAREIGDDAITLHLNEIAKADEAARKKEGPKKRRGKKTEAETEITGFADDDETA